MRTSMIFILISTVLIIFGIGFAFAGYVVIDDRIANTCISIAVTTIMMGSIWLVTALIARTMESKNK